jgi:D-glycero-beta-D-manno-heptose-7-phosphate kinase
MKNPFENLNILVCGEVCIDRYLSGKSYRKSPEANCPVINEIQTVIETPGMCGNIVENLQSLGASAQLFTLTGADSAGHWLSNQWDRTRGIIDKTRPTIVKTRILCNDVQIARLDSEKKHAVSKEPSKKYLKLLQDNVHKFDAVILQDYGKGLWNNITLKFISYCRKHNKKVFVDPYKNRRISAYRGAYLIKPNLKEAQRMSPVDYGISLPTLARKLSEESYCDYVVITCGQNMTVSSNGKKTILVAVKEVTNIKDVTGAGDTFLSVLVCSILTSMELIQSIDLANKAAGLSIQQLGPGRVTWRQLCENKL